MAGALDRRADGEGSVLEVFGTFLWLGLTAFGGPVSHLAYFRRTLVVRRAWLADEAYAELVALCQVLPGPASSQAAYAIGVRRAGLPGGVAAWSGFSLPSFLLMTAFAYGVAALSGPFAAGAIDGLKLVAVAIVAQAVLGMARTLAPDAPRLLLVLAAALATLLSPLPLTQIAVIVLGALAGPWLAKPVAPAARSDLGARLSRRTGWIALALFLVLLAAGPLLRELTANRAVAVADAFYRSGALVFGGGHVVLPLLDAAVVRPGWIGEPAFLAGYGAAQAMPGPLFSFAAYLGAALTEPPNGLAGALLAFAALSLPGLLIMTAALPLWSGLQAHPTLRAALAGASVAVVGILAAALYDPIWTGAVEDGTDAAAALAGFAFLVGLRTPPVVVVAVGAGFGVLRAALG